MTQREIEGLEPIAIYRSLISPWHWRGMTAFRGWRSVVENLSGYDADLWDLFPEEMDGERVGPPLLPNGPAPKIAPPLQRQILAPSPPAIANGPATPVAQMLPPSGPGAIPNPPSPSWMASADWSTIVAAEAQSLPPKAANPAPSADLEGDPGEAWHSPSAGDADPPTVSHPAYPSPSSQEPGASGSLSPPTPHPSPKKSPASSGQIRHGAGQEDLFFKGHLVLGPTDAIGAANHRDDGAVGDPIPLDPWVSDGEEPMAWEATSSEGLVSPEEAPNLPTDPLVSDGAISDLDDVIPPQNFAANPVHVVPLDTTSSYGNSPSPQDLSRREATGAIGDLTDVNQHLNIDNQHPNSIGPQAFSDLTSVSPSPFTNPPENQTLTPLKASSDDVSDRSLSSFYHISSEIDGEFLPIQPALDTHPAIAPQDLKDSNLGVSPQNFSSYVFSDTNVSETNENNEAHEAIDRDSPLSPLDVASPSDLGRDAVSSSIAAVPLPNPLPKTIASPNISNPNAATIAQTENNSPSPGGDPSIVHQEIAQVSQVLDPSPQAVGDNQDKQNEQNNRDPQGEPSPSPNFTSAEPIPQPLVNLFPPRSPEYFQKDLSKGVLGDRNVTSLTEIAATIFESHDNLSHDTIDPFSSPIEWSNPPSSAALPGQKSIDIPNNTVNDHQNSLSQTFQIHNKFNRNSTTKIANLIKPSSPSSLTSIRNPKAINPAFTLALSSKSLHSKKSSSYPDFSESISLAEFTHPPNFTNSKINSPDPTNFVSIPKSTPKTNADNRQNTTGIFEKKEDIKDNQSLKNPHPFPPVYTSSHVSHQGGNNPATKTAEPQEIPQEIKSLAPETSLNLDNEIPDFNPDPNLDVNSDANLDNDLASHFLADTTSEFRDENHSIDLHESPGNNDQFLSSSATPLSPFVTSATDNPEKKLQTSSFKQTQSPDQSPEIPFSRNQESSLPTEECDIITSDQSHNYSQSHSQNIEYIYSGSYQQKTDPLSTLVDILRNDFSAKSIATKSGIRLDTTTSKKQNITDHSKNEIDQYFNPKANQTVNQEIKVFRQVVSTQINTSSPSSNPNSSPLPPSPLVSGDVSAVKNTHNMGESGTHQTSPQSSLQPMIDSGEIDNLISSANANPPNFADKLPIFSEGDLGNLRDPKSNGDQTPLVESLTEHFYLEHSHHTPLGNDSKFENFPVDMPSQSSENIPNHNHQSPEEKIVFLDAINSIESSEVTFHNSAHGSLPIDPKKHSGDFIKEESIANIPLDTLTDSRVDLSSPENEIKLSQSNVENQTKKQTFDQNFQASFDPKIRPNHQYRNHPNLAIDALDEVPLYDLPPGSLSSDHEKKAENFTPEDRIPGTIFSRSTDPLTDSLISEDRNQLNKQNEENQERKQTFNQDFQTSFDAKIVQHDRHPNDPNSRVDSLEVVGTPGDHTPANLANLANILLPNPDSLHQEILQQQKATFSKSNISDHNTPDNLSDLLTVNFSPNAPVDKNQITQQDDITPTSENIQGQQKESLQDLNLSFASSELLPRPTDSDLNASPFYVLDELGDKKHSSQVPETQLDPRSPSLTNSNTDDGGEDCLILGEIHLNPIYDLSLSKSKDLSDHPLPHSDESILPYLDRIPALSKKEVKTEPLITKEESSKLSPTSDLEKDLVFALKQKPELWIDFPHNTVSQINQIEDQDHRLFPFSMLAQIPDGTENFSPSKTIAEAPKISQSLPKDELLFSALEKQNSQRIKTGINSPKIFGDDSNSIFVGAIPNILMPNAALEASQDIFHKNFAWGTNVLGTNLAEPKEHQTGKSANFYINTLSQFNHLNSPKTTPTFSDVQSTEILSRSTITSNTNPQSFSQEIEDQETQTTQQKPEIPNLGNRLSRLLDTFLNTLGPLSPNPSSTPNNQQFSSQSSDVNGNVAPRSTTPETTIPSPLSKTFVLQEKSLIPSGLPDKSDFNLMVKTQTFSPTENLQKNQTDLSTDHDVQYNQYKTDKFSSLLTKIDDISKMTALPADTTNESASWEVAGGFSIISASPNTDTNTDTNTNNTNIRPEITEQGIQGAIQRKYDDYNEINVLLASHALNNTFNEANDFPDNFYNFWNQQPQEDHLSKIHSLEKLKRKDSVFKNDGIADDVIPPPQMSPMYREASSKSPAPLPNLEKNGGTTMVGAISSNDHHPSKDIHSQPMAGIHRKTIDHKAFKKSLSILLSETIFSRFNAHPKTYQDAAQNIDLFPDLSQDVPIQDSPRLLSNQFPVESFPELPLTPSSFLVNLSNQENQVITPIQKSEIQKSDFMPSAAQTQTLQTQKVQEANNQKHAESTNKYPGDLEFSGQNMIHDSANQKITKYKNPIDIHFHSDLAQNTGVDTDINTGISRGLNKNENINTDHANGFNPAPFLDSAIDFTDFNVLSKSILYQALTSPSHFQDVSELSKNVFWSDISIFKDDHPTQSELLKYTQTNPTQSQKKSDAIDSNTTLFIANDRKINSKINSTGSASSVTTNPLHYPEDLATSPIGNKLSLPKFHYEAPSPNSFSKPLDSSFFTLFHQSKLEESGETFANVLSFKIQEHNPKSEILYRSPLAPSSLVLPLTDRPYLPRHENPIVGDMGENNSFTFPWQDTDRPIPTLPGEGAIQSLTSSPNPSIYRDKSRDIAEAITVKQWLQQQQQPMDSSSTAILGLLSSLPLTQDTQLQPNASLTLSSSSTNVSPSHTHHSPSEPPKNSQETTWSSIGQLLSSITQHQHQTHVLSLPNTFSSDRPSEIPPSLGNTSSQSNSIMFPNSPHNLNHDWGTSPLESQDNHLSENHLIFTPQGFHQEPPRTPIIHHHSSSHLIPEIQRDVDLDRLTTLVSVLSPDTQPDTKQNTQVSNQIEEIDSQSFEALAQVIYQTLKQRLEIERERHGSNYSGRLSW